MLSLPAGGYRLPAAISLLACLYLPFIGGGLLTDDFVHVEHLSRTEGVAGIVSSPDAFGFYRPLTQASLALAPGIQGERPAQARALNVFLHAGVIALAFLVARLVIGSDVAAVFAALSFALTPKAHPIAVLWISARGDLLMALSSLVAVASWIVWTRGGRSWWLAAAGVAYALALTSKETAALLPLLLIVTPRPQRTLTSRAAALIGFVAVAAAIFAWRAHTGALAPFSGNEHYDLSAPPAVWVRNAMNYSGRMVVAPLALVAIAAVAALLANVRPTIQGRSVAAFSLAWVAVFLAPVLPIRLRSELYLYLPVFGLCLLAGWTAAALIHRLDGRRVATMAIAGCAIAFTGYQVSRAYAVHQDLVFSQKLVEALRTTPHLVGRSGQLFLMPADAKTERFLERAVGGWLSVAVYHARHSYQLLAHVESARERVTTGLRLTCAYRQDQGLVIISPASP
jgi:hypothetical protein